jgi:multiple sugar transport system substrate-binding protein
MLTVCGALTMTMTVSSLTSAVASASGVTTITDWSWVPNGQMGVAGFEKVDPSVHIDLTDVGAGSSEYTKLSTAIAAGSGAPCIAQVEYDHLPAYEAKPGLVNIAQYGASQYKSAFPGWVWQLMSNGSAVYALGQDIGPVGFAYRPAIFTKYHLAVPKTWAQFGAEAVTLHKDNPNMYMTYFGNDDATMQGLTSQAGGQMFQENGSSWKVELNNPSSQKVMSFWGNLIKEGVIPVESHGRGAGTAAAAHDQPPPVELVGEALRLRLRGLVLCRHQPVPDSRPCRCRQVPRLALHVEGGHHPRPGQWQPEARATRCR